MKLGYPLQAHAMLQKVNAFIMTKHTASKKLKIVLFQRF
jgi:hypothetical protein